MDRTNINLLFFSNQCQMCRSLLAILKNENMVSYFKLYCVDDPMIRAKLPPAITKVPTIIIPSMNKKLVADEIFMWLKSLKASKEQRKQNITSNVNVENMKNKSKQPIGYINQEMSGISDMYAYTTIDEVPRHTYTACTELDKNTIFTAPETQSAVTKKEHDMYAKTLERKRNQQDTEITDLFKKQQDNIHYLQERRKKTENLINQIVEKHQHDISQII
jgi:hypothetical protein